MIGAPRNSVVHVKTGGRERNAWQVEASLEDQEAHSPNEFWIHGRAGGTMNKIVHWQRHWQRLLAIPAIVVAITIALGPGCAEYRTFELSTQAAHTHQSYQEKEGLAVAARLIVDPQAVTYHFGAEMSEEGYFPVIVYVENRGDSSFEIERARFSVHLENKASFEPVPPMEVITEIRKSHVLTFLSGPLLLPPFFVYRAIEDYNFDMAKNIHEKALPASIRIEKGDAPITKTLFFRDPQAGVRSREEFQSAVLEFIVNEEGTRPTGESGSNPPKIGRLVTFTVSLPMEDSR
jgi:hypothetical protein